MKEKYITTGIYTASLNGHRQAYLDFLLDLFPSQRIQKKEVVFSKAPVLFMMIEESFLFYFFTSVFRNMLGRRTVGLLFRPKPAVEAKNIQLVIKRTMLYFLKRLSNVKTITILPFCLNPSFEKIADNWIYDFQLWDLTKADLDKFAKYQEGVVATTIDLPTTLPNESNIVVAIGQQDKKKGFPNFVSSIQSNVGSHQYVFGGKATHEMAPLIKVFEESGGIANNRFISDDEIIQLYSVSSVVWCVYNEAYDQASGVLGRAVQFGRPVIVRKGSMMHNFCEIESLSYITDEEFYMNGFKQEKNKIKNEKLSENFKNYSFKILTSSLTDQSRK